MKKLTAIILALALSISTFALAESADYLGTWYLNEMVMEGNAISPTAFGMDMTMEINEDGTALLKATVEDGGEQAATWALDGDTLTVTVEGEEMTLTLQDGALIGEQGGMGMNFGREKVEAEIFEPAAPKANATEADYAGTWQSTYVDMNGQFMAASLMSLDLTAVIDGATMTLDGMFVFENTAVDITFADGALAHEGGEGEMYNDITAQLLEDGTMQMTLTAGDTPLVLIMEKAE